MARLQAIRIQLAGQRRLGRLVAALLLLTGLAALVVGLHAGPLLLSALSPGYGSFLLQVLAVLGLLLIPISGVISVTSQFAFWSGWLGGLPQPFEIFTAASATSAADGPADGPADSDDGQTNCAIVYLDGIHQSERDHPPRVAAFLELLESQLPESTRLFKGIEAYTVTTARLADDVGGGWFWRRLFALQEHHPNALVSLICAVLVQANNVIKVGISSDRRYGPILNYELAIKVAQLLAQQGFRPGPNNGGSPHELVLLGYSGGGEMALGMADYLRRICRCPVRVITFCGVFSGNQLLEQVAQVAMVVGSRDPVAAFGRIAYPGRSPLLPLSNWNRAKARGQVRRHCIRGLTHNGSCGPFSDRHRQEIVAAIVGMVREH